MSPERRQQIEEIANQVNRLTSEASLLDAIGGDGYVEVARQDNPAGGEPIYVITHANGEEVTGTLEELIDPAA